MGGGGGGRRVEFRIEGDRKMGCRRGGAAGRARGRAEGGRSGADARTTGKMTYQVFIVSSFFLGVEIVGLSSLTYRLQKKSLLVSLEDASMLVFVL
jgi:hypothetical protein